MPSGIPLRFFVFCSSECSNNTYGQACRQTCGNCINSEQCDHVNGSCPNGCDAGMMGDKCDTGDKMKKYSKVYEIYLFLKKMNISYNTYLLIF